MTEDEPFRSVWMTPELMDKICTRDNDGNRLVVVWGKPDQNGYFTPTITTVYSDNIVRDRDGLWRKCLGVNPWRPEGPPPVASGVAESMSMMRARSE